MHTNFFKRIHAIVHPERHSVSEKGRTIHWASWYDRVVSLMMLGRSKKLRQMTVRLARLEPGQRVLDIGCGTGDLTHLAKTAVGELGHVIGIDAAAEMIAVAQEKYPEGDFRLAAVEQLPFPDNSFDVVVSSLVLHHLPGELKEAGMQEVWRVLKPNGRSVHVDFARQDGPSQAPNYGQLERLLKGAGFANVKAQKTDFRWLAVVEGRKAI
ncbi:MAG: methyltransferase domain-containing protein [Chloroflexota bacterium]